jgi:superfamily II DNA/RNA helicase
VAVYGGADMNKQIKALAGGVEAIIATPGRLIDLVDRKEVELGGLEIVVVDEADRMADMGFLPQVEWLLRHVDNQHQTLLFSATLDGVVDGLIKRYQHDPVYHEVASSTVTVDAMLHRFIAVHEMDKVKVAASIARSSGRVLAFTNTKRVADRLASALKDEGVRAAAIHGDLRQGQREDALKDFTSGKLKVLVATDVAARGLHIDDVDVVIHYDPAPDHKTYLHRSGRTARAGSKGLAVSLSIWNEELHIKRLQKRIGVIQPITEMFSNDARLADLSAWEPGTA